MNTMTLDEATLTRTREDAVAPQAPTVRVALREIREYAYRSLVVAGASPGEAATAAGQVLHAELHAGEGVAGLVSDLALGPWPRAGLTCIRRPGRRSVLEVSCGTRAGELRIGAPLVDLVAGEPTPAIAATTADLPLTALLDEVLLAAAMTTGTTVTAIRHTEHRRYAVRYATAAGDLAHGLTELARAASLTDVDRLLDGEALIVLTGETLEAARTLTWSRRGERADRRREAAKVGVEVDGTAWQMVAEHASRFLVPEV